jgi:glyoxylase-like metal-dependent hydrolase (beta-lactamase superfamily II)
MMNIETIVLGRVETNCYLLTTNSTAVLIDASEKGNEITAAVREVLVGRNLDAIILTHGHWDHVGGVPILVADTGAKVYIHEDEIEQLNWGLDRVPQSKKLFAGVDHLLKDGELLKIGDISFKVMLTPGHTSASICLYDDASGLLFSGDTLFHHSRGRTDFPTGDIVAMRETLQNLATLPPETKVFPGHRGTTTIGEELKNGLAMTEE